MSFVTSSRPSGAPRLLSATIVLLVASGVVGSGCDDRRPRRDAGPIPGVDTGVPTSDAPLTFRCTPNLPGCYGNIAYVCGADGVSRVNEVPCSDACDPALGCVACRPGSRRCSGTVSEVCNEDGTGYGYGRDCGAFAVECGSDGYCADACADAERTNSNVGCEYWPTPLPNSQGLDPSLYDFRIVVANPNDTAANVRVTRGGATTTTVTIPAHGVQDVALPWIDGQSFAIPGSGWKSFVVQGAYRVLSDAPVIVSQFNPFEYYNPRGTEDPFTGSDTKHSYTNDASLLLPAHVLTGNYVAASYLPLSIVDSGLFSDTPGGQPGYISIVAIAPGTTSVQVTTSGNVAASADGRVPATSRGGSFVLSLSQGEVANIVAASPPACGRGRPGYREVTGSGGQRYACSETEYDLTGTQITANQPVVTFGGHACAYVPYFAQACDHLEEQMAPIETLGREYVGAPMGDGNLGTTNIVRVIAGSNGTNVTIEGSGAGSRAMNAGDVMEFEASGPFRVSADHGVMVAQYLRGQYVSEPAAARGDPAVTTLVPSEQFRSDYTFILPTSYNPTTQGQNFVLVTRTPGQSIVIDGTPLSGGSFAPIGGYEIGVVPLTGGTHTMTSTEPFGLVTYGLGQYTSYATPAGLNLEPINILY